MVNIDIKIPKNLSQKFDRILTAELKKADELVSKLLLEYAKRNHDYKSRSGRLDSAIKVKGTLETGLYLYVDLKVADYGEYIINGFGTWNADDFIREALVHNADKINKILNTAVNTAVNKMNSGV